MIKDDVFVNPCPECGQTNKVEVIVRPSEKRMKLFRLTEAVVRCDKCGHYVKVTKGAIKLAEQTALRLWNKEGSND